MPPVDCGAGRSAASGGGSGIPPRGSGRGRRPNGGGTRTGASAVGAAARSVPGATPARGADSSSSVCLSAGRHSGLRLVFRYWCSGDQSMAAVSRPRERIRLSRAAVISSASSFDSRLVRWEYPGHMMRVGSSTWGTPRVCPHSCRNTDVSLWALRMP